MTSQQPIDVGAPADVCDVLETYEAAALSDEMLLTEIRRFIDQGLKLVDMAIEDIWKQRIVILSSGDAIILPEYKSAMKAQIYLSEAARTLALDEIKVFTSSVSTINRVRDLFTTVESIEMQASRKGELSDALRKMVAETLHLCVAVKAEDFRIRVERDQTSLSVVILDTQIPFKTLTVSEGKALCTSHHSSSSGHSNTQYLEGEKQVCQMSAHDPKHPGNKQLFPPALENVRLAFTNIAGGHRLMTGRCHYARDVHNFIFSTFGYTGHQEEAFRRFRNADGGGCVISGPMNSGKNTALSLLMKERHREQPGKIQMSVEEPVEILMDWVDQMSIENTGTSSSADEEAKKAIAIILRSKAHDIMMSEVKENSPLGPVFLQVSISGQKGLTTTHSQTAPGVIDRFLSLGLNKDLVFNPSCMQLLASQRLIKRLCTHCSIPLETAMQDNRHPDVLLFRATASLLDDDLGRARIRGEGCQKCEEAILPKPVRNSLASFMPRASLDRLKTSLKAVRGYTGRSLIAEVLEPDRRFMELYRTEGQFKATEYWVKDRQGFRLFDHALQKIRAGEIDPRDCSLMSLKQLG